MANNSEMELEGAIYVVQQMLKGLETQDRNWGLLKCKLDDKDVIAIAYMRKDKDDTIITPLFIYVTDDMVSRLSPPEELGNAKLEVGTLGEIFEEEEKEQEEEKVIN